MAARKKQSTTPKRTSKRRVVSKSTARKTSSKSPSRKSTTTKGKKNPSESMAVVEKPKASRLYWVIVVVALLLLLYLLRGLIVVSIVNGRPVYRLSVVNRLEQLGGDRVVDEITRRYVVEDELVARGITISDEEIEAEIDEARQLFEQQGISFEDALEKDNLTLDDVREISRYQRGLRLLAEQEVDDVTDEEVSSYYEENRDFYKDKSFDDVKEDIRQALKEQSLQQKEQEILNSLLAKANVVVFKQY